MSLNEIYQLLSLLISRSWPYGSGIYDYAISSNPTQASFTQYNNMWKLYQWLVAGRLFSPSSLVSSINKTYRHDIAEMLWKVTLTP